MFTSRKYRIYPNKEQEIALIAHINNVRLVYNLALETKNIAYFSYNKKLSRYDLQKQLPELKKEFPYLCETNSQSYQVALRDLDTAFLNFFRDLKNGNIEKRRVKYLERRASRGLKVNWDFYHSIGKPNFKNKKSDYSSFCVPQNWTILDGKLFIPKIRSGIKVKVNNQSIGRHLEARISLTTTKKWFISFTLETASLVIKKKPINEENTVGVDLGIKDFATLSSGQKFTNHRFMFNGSKKISRVNKKLLRKEKGSNNYEKQRIKIAKLYEKITNQRKDFLHKTSTAITKQYDNVVVEDLNIKGLFQNKKMSKLLSDVGWFTFKQMLLYKLNNNGGNLIIANRWFPSSKMHNKCGLVNKNLLLEDRDWVCVGCGETVDRDLNAAINIKNFGLGKPTKLVENITLVNSMKQALAQNVVQDVT